MSYHFTDSSSFSDAIDFIISCAGDMDISTASYLTTGTVTFPNEDDEIAFLLRFYDHISPQEIRHDGIHGIH